MVRRWSHINVFTNLRIRPLRVAETRTRFNLFKANVKFKNLKKLRVKFSKIKRRAFRRLKHRSNFLSYGNVFKFWTLDYRLVRNSARFDYFYYIFLDNILFYNYNYLKNNSEQIFYNTSFLISNLNRIMLSARSLYRSNPLMRGFLANSNHAPSFAWLPDADAQFDLSLYVPIFSKCDDSLVPVVNAENLTPLNYPNAPSPLPPFSLFIWARLSPLYSLAQFYFFLSL